MEAESSGMTYSKHWNEKNTNQEFYILQNYSSNLKEKLRHSQMNKNEEN